MRTSALARAVGLALALVLALALAAAPPGTAAAGPSSRQGTGQAHRWKTYNGPYFNDPHVKADHFKIEGKVIDTIDHARKGSFIRIAVYSFDRLPVAHAIVAAYHRG